MPRALGLRLCLGLVGTAALVVAGLTYGEVIDLWRLGLQGPRLPLLLTVVGVVTLAAGVLFGPSAGLFLRRMARWPRGLQGLVAVLLVVAMVPPFVPAGPQARLAIPFFLGLLGTAVLVGALGSGGLKWLSLPVKRFSEWLEARSTATVVSVAAVVLLATAATLSVLLFNRTPHVVDGVAYLFQVKIFRFGAFSLPAPPLPEFFNVDTVVTRGRWFAQYPPGHAVALLVGDLVRAPWLVNPVLGAMTVVAFHALGRELYDGITARWAIVLLVLSPFVFLISAEFYSHGTALLLCTLFLLFYARWVRGGGALNGLGAGVVLGLCALTRPLTTLAIGLPVFVDLLLRARRGELLQTRHAPGLLLGAASVVALVAIQFGYNRLTSGHALTFGYALADGPGFGLSEFIPHIRTLDRLRLLNDALFAWPIPSLILVLGAFLGGTPSRWDYFLVGIFASFVLVHAPVAYRDDEFGPRYLYEATGALILLSARGLQRSGEVLNRFVTALDVRSGRDLVRTWVVFLFLIGITTHWYPHVAYYGSPGWRWAVHDDSVRAARDAGLSNAIVFVAEPDGPYPRRWWNVAFLQNSVPLEASPVIYARDLGERNVELMRLYPSRQAFVALRDSLERLP